MPSRTKRIAAHHVRTLARGAGTLLDIGGVTGPRVRPDIEDTYTSLLKDAVAIGEDYRGVARRVARRAAGDGDQHVGRRAE